MKPGRTALAIAAILTLWSMANVMLAQQMPLGHATDFTSRTYFEPPNEQKVKMKLTGSEASPLPGGLLEVKRLQIESYDATGKTNAIIEAPQCIYSPLDGVANSAGHITMRTSDGKLHVEGDGFLWRQSDNSLTISNNVNTKFQSGVLKFNGP